MEEFFKGQTVRVCVTIKGDVPGKELGPGMTGVIYETPDINNGMYSMAVGYDVYDVDTWEIEAIDPECSMSSKNHEDLCDRDTATQTRSAAYNSNSGYISGDSGEGCTRNDTLMNEKVVPCEKSLTMTGKRVVTGTTKSRSNNFVFLSERMWWKGVQQWFDAVAPSAQNKAVQLQGALSTLRLSCFEAAKESSSGAHVHRLPGCTKPSLRDKELSSREMFVGVSLLDLERAEDAYEHFARAISLDPLNFECYKEYSVALEEEGNIEKAGEIAEQASKFPQVGWVSKWQRPGYMHGGITSRAFWDTSEFGWVEQLEGSVDVIRQELMTSVNAEGEANDWDEVGGSHRESGRRDGSVLVKGDWREKVLFGNGAIPSAQCPRTRSLLRQLVPDAVDLCERGAGEVIFSALSPGTHIAPHCAPTNLRLTAHLGLMVPPMTPGCRCQIRVGSEWKYGHTRK